MSSVERYGEALDTYRDCGHVIGLHGDRHRPFRSAEHAAVGSDQAVAGRGECGETGGTETPFSDHPLVLLEVVFEPGVAEAGTTEAGAAEAGAADAATAGAGAFAAGLSSASAAAAAATPSRKATEACTLFFILDPD